MESIEDKMKMRNRVDKLDDQDKGSRISENRSKIHELANEENIARKRIQERIEKEGRNVSVGSPLVGDLANLHSTETLKRMETEKELWLDGLTGLRNRKALEGEVPGLLSRIFKREGKDCSLLFLDLDLFKKINDTHGHLAGDTVLKEFAILVKNAVRESDIAYRWGGEEFAIFLPDAGSGGASEVAERIRNELEKHVFNVIDKEGRAVELKITISAGCATASSADPDFDKETKPEDIFKLAARTPCGLAAGYSQNL